MINEDNFIIVNGSNLYKKYINEDNKIIDTNLCAMYFDTEHQFLETTDFTIENNNQIKYDLKKHFGQDGIENGTKLLVYLTNGKNYKEPNNIISNKYLFQYTQKIIID